MTIFNRSEIGHSADEAVAYVQSVPVSKAESMQGVPFEKRDVVCFGFVGVGERGFGQLKKMLLVDGARITVIFDPNDTHAQRAKEEVVKSGQPAPDIESDWQKLCERKDLDCVYISSPWAMHAPQAVYAMECGKHAAVEVPVVTTLADCWKLVDTSERTRRHCVILENCCYGEMEMMVLNMVRAGLFGTITHGEASYIHDLRSILLSDTSEGLWRRESHKTRNGNLYPTHGLGPVSRYMNIHRGDRMTRLVSMSSLSAALPEYRDAKAAVDSPYRQETYPCGDMNSSLIQTARGRTILLQHDVVTPRPYSRSNLIAGSKGTFSDFPPRIFIDGHVDPACKHDWKTPDDFKAQYLDPLWNQYGKKARAAGGHGGMDFLMNYCLVRSFLQGVPPDMDVYDAAAWSAPGPLSEISVAWESLPLPFPDFTRGHWDTNCAVK